MLGAEMICSDEGCAREAEVIVTSLDQLDRGLCDECGCLLTTLALWRVVEVRPRIGTRVALPLPDRCARRSAARLAA